MKRIIRMLGSVLLSFIVSVLAAAGIYLLSDLAFEDKAVQASLADAEPSYVKIYSPSPTEPTEPPTEPITYEMQIDMDIVRSYHDSYEDVIGWLYIQDTVINYPIVQADDNAYYMDRNWKGQYSYAGSIFADWQCTLDGSDNALVYGHNMANGTMLHAIKYYKDPASGETHRYFEVASLEKRYLYEVISVNVIYGEAGADFTYWNCIDMTEEEYDAFVQNIRRTSYVWYGDEANLPQDGEDRIITLQTCNSGASDGMRCVVFARCIGER